MARDRLGQKIRALQVCAQQFLEAVLVRVEQIRAYTRSASGVVDERVDPAQRLIRLAGEAYPIRPLREIATHVVHYGAERTELVEAGGGASLRAPGPPPQAPARV